MIQQSGCVSNANVQFVEQFLLFRLQEEADMQLAFMEAQMETEERFIQEVADRFVKKIVIYKEGNIEVEWKF